MSNSNRKIATTLMACLLAFATLAVAQNGPVVEVIKTRQQGLKDMGASLKTARDQLRKSEPDMTAIKAAGENIKVTASKMETWFPHGSGPEAGIKTAAKAEIWRDADTFDQKRRELVAAAETFARLTAAGDKATIVAAVSPLNRTCKGCHDLFFEDDK